MIPEITNPLFQILVLAGVFYLGMPIVLRFQQRYPARPDLLPLDFDSLDPKVARFLTSRSEAVLRLGFAEPTLVRIANAAPRVESYPGIVRVEDAARLEARAVLDVRGLEPVRPVTDDEGHQRPVAARAVDQYDQVLPAFSPAPQATRTQTPSLHDPGELYRLHQFVMDRDGAEGPKVTYDPGEALDYLIEYAFIKMYDVQVARGWLRYRPAEDAYRPTVLGAYLLAWGLLPPLKWLRQLLLVRREKVVLRAFRRAQQEATAAEPGPSGSEGREI